ncbi:MAG: hypothetical protein IAE97_02860 [Chthoniobacterales bacterium]|nr:hypothetical protein [Chthoniobacterales bacterium]
MQLSDFISETLVQIATGIDQANAALSASKAKVNPENVFPSDSSYNSTVYGHIQTDQQMNPAVHLIQFDVAVYAAEETETKGGIGIMVGTIGLGSQGRSDATSSTTSRIQFGIPMLLPSAKA